MFNKLEFIPTIEKRLLWKKIPYIALGLACCGINESSLLFFPIESIFSWQVTPENIFTNFPNNILITLATILFLGLIFHQLNKRFILTLPMKLQGFPQVKRSNIFNIYNTPLYILLTIFCILTIVIQQPNTEVLPSGLPFKGNIYGVYTAVIMLIAYSVLIVFPPAYACITYALTALFTILFSELYRHTNTTVLFSIKSIIPLLGSAFLVWGRPKTKIIETLFFEKTLHINSLFSKKATLTYVVLCILSLLNMFQLFLNIKMVVPFQNNFLDPKTHNIFIYTLNMQLIGALLVAWFIKWKENTPLLLFMIIFALLSVGTISQIIFLEGIIPILIIQLALGLAGSLCIALLSVLTYNPKHIYTMLSIALFFINSIGYLLGYILWEFSLFIENYAIAITHIYIPVLSIMGVLSILFLQVIPSNIITKVSKLCYLLNLKPVRLNEYAYLDKLQYLTPREKEVLNLVQQGLKNIEISNRLQITESTLRVHLRNTYRKLNINGRQKLKALPYNSPLNVENTS